MAPSSQTTQNLDESCDRFNDLPNHILYQIFSFLGDNDTARISVLSRRFRQLCVSSPYLCFNSNFDSDKGSRSSAEAECTSKCIQFSNYLDRLLSLHNGMEMEIHRLCLHWTCDNPDYYKEGSLLDTWIQNAVKCKVQELDLRFCPKYGEVFVLPHFIFSCKTLSVLKLNLEGRSLELPSMAFASLKILSLECVKVVNESLGEWISTSCISLKKLELVSVSGFVNLSMTSSSLEDLTICKVGHCHINLSTERLLRLSLRLSYSFSPRSSLKIDAPNLQLLKWEGDIVYDTTFDNFMSLQDAAINLNIHNQGEDSTSKFLLKLLGRLTSARVLQLRDWIIEILFIQGCLPILFGNVRHLVVTTRSFNDFKISVLATFLMDFLNLETLIIKFDKDSGVTNLDESNFKQEYGESQNQMLTDQLKEVEIELSGKKNETGGLVKYFLKHAKGLKKMTIYYSISYFYMLSQIGIQNLERASPTVEVFLLLKEIDEDGIYPLGRGGGHGPRFDFLNPEIGGFREGGGTVPYPWHSDGGYMEWGGA